MKETTRQRKKAIGGFKEAFDFTLQTGVEKAQITEIAKLDFVGRKQGLVIAGNSGTGKSHIAKALLLIGCTQLHRCRYTTAADMLTDLLASRADHSFQRKLRQYNIPCPTSS